MSDINSLLKQADLFHKLALYGNRKSFLKATAQNLTQGTLTFPDETVDIALGSAAGSAGNLATMLAKRPESSQLQVDAKKISAALSNSRSASFVSSKQELDAKTAPIKTALTQLGNLATTVNGIADMDPETKQMAQQAKGEADRALNVIDNFYQKHGVHSNEESPSLVGGPAPVSNKPAEPKKEVQSQAEMAKNLAKSILNKVSKLTTGAKRVEQLRDLDNNIKMLKSVWTILSNKKTKDLQDYFTRMEISEAIKQVYNSLNYNDLETVKSLDFGRGIPEME